MGQRRRGFIAARSPVLRAATLAAAFTVVPGWAQAPGSTFRDCPECPEMVVIPAGQFNMGSPPAESGQTDEKPVHAVKFARPYALSRFEVTFDEWDACAAAGKCPRPGDDDLGRGRRPAINVSWTEATAYAAWLAERTGQPYRLVSEEEWEYAARAGTTTPWFWGEAENSAGSSKSCKYANTHDESSKKAHPNYVWSHQPCDDGYPETAPVGSYLPNPFGLSDMLGNVREWVADCHHLTYQGAPDDGRAWLESSCEQRVVRGGSWFDGAQTSRAAYRHTLPDSHRSYQVGVRVARDLAQ